jgi:hypothetical protein
MMEEIELNPERLVDQILLDCFVELQFTLRFYTAIHLGYIICWRVKSMFDDFIQA